MYKAAVAVAATSISSIIGSWFTPSSLFIFLNLVIALIVIISRFTPPKTLIHESLQLLRSPPLLDRFSSYNYQYAQTTESTQLQHVREREYVQPEYKNQCPNPDNDPQEPKLALAPVILQQLQSIKVSCLLKPESIHGEKEPELKPEPQTEGPELKRRESGCEEDEDEDEEEEEEEEENEGRWLREETEIGLKADDFINMFKKQLRLQRVDSFNRYRDMLN